MWFSMPKMNKPKPQNCVTFQLQTALKKCQDESQQKMRHLEEKCAKLNNRVIKNQYQQRSQRNNGATMSRLPTETDDQSTRHMRHGISRSIALLRADRIMHNAV